MQVIFKTDLFVLGLIVVWIEVGGRERRSSLNFSCFPQRWVELNRTIGKHPIVIFQLKRDFTNSSKISLNSAPPNPQPSNTSKGPDLHSLVKRVSKGQLVHKVLIREDMATFDYSTDVDSQLETNACHKYPS